MTLKFEMCLEDFMATFGCHKNFSKNAWLALYKHFEKTNESGAVIDAATMFYQYREVNMHTLLDLYVDEYPKLLHTDWEDRLKFLETLDDVIRIDGGGMTTIDPNRTWLVPYARFVKKYQQ